MVKDTVFVKLSYGWQYIMERITVRWWTHRRVKLKNYYDYAGSGQRCINRHQMSTMPLAMPVMIRAFIVNQL